MKTVGLLLALLGIYGLVDTIDRATDERLAYHAWLREACIPTRAGESAVIISDGRQMRCRIYTRNTTGYAPIIASSAVMEVPR